MPISEKLAYSQKRKDQLPNKETARIVLDAEDRSAIQELCKLIDSDFPKRLKMDATLTLAYIAEEKPELLKSHTDFLIDKLQDPIERVGWGSMIALSHMSSQASGKLYDQLPAILDAMDRDSIVGRDHGFRILVSLYVIDSYQEDLHFIILEQLRKVRPNQLGQYTERYMGVIKPHHKKDLIAVLEEDRSDLNEYHIKRLAKNLKKLYK